MIQVTEPASTDVVDPLVQNTIRLPASVWARLRAGAERDARTLNAHMGWCIERGMDAADRAAGHE